MSGVDPARANQRVVRKLRETPQLFEIEYFYSAHSAFAYLGSRRFMEIAAAAGRKIVHKPYYLNRGIAGVGSVPTRERPQNHRAYYFRREIDRWSEHREAPVMPGYPTHHWADMTLANCMLIAAANTIEIAEIYGANTDEVIKRSVFGSPTYFVDGDMFYGQDHLEMVERALERPYKPSSYG